MSVGATNAGDTVASFSSRGPVTTDGSARMKPDVAAPGVGIRSSFPNGRYGQLSGTSMAGPHVAGSVALLWSAAPQLRGDLDATEEIIEGAARARTTGQGCGDDDYDDVPNNVYGWGIVDGLGATPQTWVETSARAEILEGFAPSGIRCTFTFTNVGPVPLTGVTITSTVPTSAALTHATGDYEVVAEEVRWDVGEYRPGEVLSRTLRVSLPTGSSGTRICCAYGLRAQYPTVPPWASEVDVLVPWRILLVPIFKNGPVGER